MKLPTPSPALVRALEELYPDRCPDPSTSDRDIWIAVGAAQVVRLLRHKLDERASHQMEDDA